MNDRPTHAPALGNTLSMEAEHALFQLPEAVRHRVSAMIVNTMMRWPNHGLNILLANPQPAGCGWHFPSQLPEFAINVVNQVTTNTVFHVRLVADQYGLYSSHS